MNRLIPLVLILVLGCLASPVMAQRRGGERPGRSPEAVQKRLLALFDRNDDGRLDRREFMHARRALRALRPEARRGEARPEGGTTPRPRHRRAPRGEMRGRRDSMGLQPR